ncbi:hypothetical protein HC864_02535 [Candidatus Gracilibacteria bacterium]|nr:hypothetical protein [Candidatus Gracilibacteria bacterium]
MVLIPTVIGLFGLILGVVIFLITNLPLIIFFGVAGYVIYKSYKLIKKNKGQRLKIYTIKEYNNLEKKRQPKSKYNYEGSKKYNLINWFYKILRVVGLLQFLGFWSWIFILVVAFLMAWIGVTFRFRLTNVMWTFGDNKPGQIRPALYLIPLVILYPFAYVFFPWLIVLGLHIVLILLHAIYGWYVEDFDNPR